MPSPGTSGVSTQGSVAVMRYMPIPHSRDAPLFTGKFVSDFLSTLKSHGTAAGLSEDDLPPLIHQYCSDDVKSVLRYSKALQAGSTWVKAVEHMKNLYGAGDEPPLVQPSIVIAYCSQMSKLERFATRLDLEKYNREFHAMSSQLEDKKLWTDKDTNLWFYRGLPREHREHVKASLDTKYRLITDPFPMDEALKVVKSTFDPNQIDVAWDVNGIADSSLFAQTDTKKRGRTVDGRSSSPCNASEGSSSRSPHNTSYRCLFVRRRSLE